MWLIQHTPNDALNRRSDNLSLLGGNFFTGHFDRRGQKLPDFRRFYQSKSGNYQITETQIQGDIVYMCDEFGEYRKLYVEVIRMLYGEA